MKRRKKVLLGLLGVLVALLVVWVALNPPGTFGFCSFAFTTYNCIPYPAVDIQVRVDGASRRVAKTHGLELPAVQWLLDSKPDVLIISIGWQGAVNVPQAIREIKGCTVEVLTTDAAIDRFGQLKKEGKKVAIHVHSTC